MIHFLFKVLVFFAFAWPALAADNMKTEGAGPYTAVIKKPSGGFEVQTYMNAHGLAIVEGDIVIGAHADVQKDTLRNIGEILRGLDPQATGVDPKDFGRLSAPAAGTVPLFSGPVRPFSLSISNVWPNKTVPFTIDPAIDVSQRATILHAAQIWNALGIVTFSQTASQLPDEAVLHVLPAGAGASGFCVTSHPGRTAKNTTYLSSDCTLYQIVHEFGHVLGLRHEQSRADRDTYLAIDESRIQSQYRSNFDTQSGSFDATKYDPCSVMHYGDVVPGAWTTTGVDERWFTLTRKGNQAFANCVKALPALASCRVVGQRCAISPTDRAGVAALYP